MKRYFTLQFVTDDKMILAYRGENENNTIERPIPVIDDAQKIPLQAEGLSLKDLGKEIQTLFLPLAQQHIGHEVIIMVKDDLGYAWVMD